MSEIWSFTVRLFREPGLWSVNFLASRNRFCNSWLSWTGSVFYVMDPEPWLQPASSHDCVRPVHFEAAPAVSLVRRWALRSNRETSWRRHCRSRRDVDELASLVGDSGGSLCVAPRQAVVLLRVSVEVVLPWTSGNKPRSINKLVFFKIRKQMPLKLKRMTTS